MSKSLESPGRLSTDQPDGINLVAAIQRMLFEGTPEVDRLMKDICFARYAARRNSKGALVRITELSSGYLRLTEEEEQRGRVK